MIDPTELRARAERAMADAKTALSKPVDIAWLAFFRIGFGAVLLWETYRYLSGTRIERYYIEPGFYFKYYGFEWVEPWPGQWMYFHFWVLGALSACVMLGLFYRVAMPLFFVGFSYVFLLDQTEHLNHFYLVCLLSFVMSLLPAHRAYSIDALRKPELRSLVVPAWTLWALRAQIGVTYFYAGVAKLNGDWLRAEPLRMWLAKRIDIIGEWVVEPWAPYFFAYGGTIFDLFVVPGLLYRRTRYPFLAAGFFFHLTNSQLFKIGIFPWMSMVALVIFLPHDLPRKLLVRLPRYGSRFVLKKKDKKLKAETRAEGIFKKLLAAHLVLQVLIPLRQHLYPGKTAWTQEGHRFSWRMKLRSGDGECSFRVLEPWSREEGLVDPYDVLVPRQAQKFASRPDMILQFAHYLADRFEEQRGKRPEVYANCMNSLNGRPAAPLVDPRVDLAKVERSILPAKWILPLEVPLPSYEARLATARRMADNLKNQKAIEEAAAKIRGEQDAREELDE